MNSYKRLTLLALTVLGLSSQVVLANDTSHSTTAPMTSSTSSSTNTSTSNSQASTETSSSTASSSEQESKPSLSTETKPNQPIQTGWVKEGNKWTFYSQTGVKFTDTLYDGYLFDSHGYLLENTWYQMGNNWYYINGSGKYLSNQWSQINGKWYAFDGYGRMLANVWKGDYYLKSSGAMQIGNGSTTKATLVGFTSNLADAMPKNNGLVPTILNLVATWPIRNGFTTQTIKLGTILRMMVCMLQEPMLWMVKTSSSKGMENGFVN